MIAFASSVTAPEIYERCALPGFGVAGAREQDVLSLPARGSIFASYNAILDRAAALPELEALVLVHQDAEIVDPEFCAKLRHALGAPGAGVVGCVGALGVRNVAWWEGSTTWGSFVHRYQELGGGEFPAFSWDDRNLPPYARTGEVDMVDGFVLGLAPWVVEHVRFDESLGLALHGYDFDFCQQVRAAGRKVLTADFKVIHHHSLELVSDPETYIEAHMKLADKWEARLHHDGGPPAGADWRRRALRAEAEAAAARAQGLGARAETEARERAQERELAEVLGSTSWRLTAPLRGLARLVRR